MSFDCVIVGGGVIGTSLLYTLSRFTNLNRIMLIEKKPSVGLVNTHATQNSQTLHCGDIETNYSLEKVLNVKKAAQKVAQYCTSNAPTLLKSGQKLVLGVGDQECAFLTKRFDMLRPHFPYLKFFDAGALAKIEPEVVRGRKEQIVAYGAENEPSTVDFGKLAESFVASARTAGEKNKKEIAVVTDTKCLRMIEGGDADTVCLHTTRGDVRARFVVFSAGAHSLLFAQHAGLGKQYSCTPAVGNFFFTPELLRGKVYTVQNELLPFAAIHGDPDLVMNGQTRWGPTAFLTPLLERRNWSSSFDFFRLLHLDGKLIRTYWNMFKVKDVRNFMFRNVVFEIPLIGRHVFANQVRKIAPSVPTSMLKEAKGWGGLRPVLVDKPNTKLLLGEAKIIAPRAIYNMTPSPGASSCLGISEVDAKLVAKALKAEFFEGEFARAFPANAQKSLLLFAFSCSLNFFMFR